MKKEYIIRSYELDELIKSEDEGLEKLLNEEFGEEEFSLCSVVQLNSDNKVIYKFIFVRDKKKEN